MLNDNPITILLLVVFGALIAGTIATAIVATTAKGDRGQAIARNLAARMKSWWVMSGVFAISVLAGGTTTIVLFAISSFLALREFVTITPTGKGDHRGLFWAFFAILPVQYILLAQERLELFAIFIPVYAFVLIPARIATAGNTTNYLARASKIQWGLMTCVYFISHAPALLLLDLGEGTSSAALLFFFILIVQLNDVFQYIVGTLIGKHKVIPTVSPNKTTEGLIGGLLLSAATGAAMAWATPFTISQAALVALVIPFMGFLGDITMSAIKRDLGVKDTSTMIPGHGGILDRLDSLTFAAPVFFHIVKWMFQV